MRWPLLLAPVLVISGVVAAVVLHRPAPLSAPAAVAPALTVRAVDAGLSDEEVFEASRARLAEARRRAEAELAAVQDAGPVLGVVVPGDGARPPALAAAADRPAPPGVRAEVERVAARLAQDDLPGAVEQVHALFRAHSEAAGPALELVALAAQSRARKGALAKVEPVLPRMQELPSSEPVVRAALARVLATVAVATARAGQPERSLQRARAALALDESTPEAYLALGEYQFQDNDLPGALDTWEHGLRLNPGDPALGVRLERGRAEAERLGGLERVASEHFVVAFDGRADVPAARASLEVMEAAYRSVGALFQSYPEGPIPLVLYPERSFDQEGHASWSAAVFDGKIRLPSAGADAHSARFGGTLFHEYGHALFHRATGGRHAPSWLNEGFADVARLRADPGPAVRCTPDVHRFPLRALEGGFQRIPDHRSAHLAYLEGRHAVERVIERHGEAGIRALLAEVSTGAPFAVAFERALGEDYGTFAATFDAEARR
ncbi:MAG: tetratricopeptide repeat protein [Myxococcaceae bacterium]